MSFYSLSKDHLTCSDHTSPTRVSCDILIQEWRKLRSVSHQNCCLKLSYKIFLLFIYILMFL